MQTAILLHGKQNEKMLKSSNITEGYIKQTREHAAKIFSLQTHWLNNEAYHVSEDDLLLWIWPQTFSSTNPFGIGGQGFTTMSVLCWENTTDNSDCILYLNDRYQYHDRFQPMIRFNTKRFCETWKE